MPNISDLDVVNSVIELFADKSRHTTGEFAKNAHAESCDYTDTQAVCWCLSGGLLYTLETSGSLYPTCYKQYNYIMELLFSLLPNKPLSDKEPFSDSAHGQVVAYNDNAGYEGVMQLLYAARTALAQQDSHNAN